MEGNSRAATEHRPVLAEVWTGSFVIEKHIYTTKNGNSRVQWLAEVVGEDGGLWLMEACETRREALDVIDKHGTQAARNAYV